jgi:hypothetical protein
VNQFSIFSSIILLLLVAALGQHLLLCQFAMPFADDFCFAWTSAEPIPFFQKVCNQYFYWNGRFTSDFLIQFHPYQNGSVASYQLTIFSFVLLTPVIFFCFFKEVLNLLKINGTAVVSISLPLLFTLLYFTMLPQPAEGLYWFTGVVNYHLAVLAAFLMFILLLVTKRVGDSSLKTGFRALAVILSIVATGFNEIGAVILPSLLLVLLFFERKFGGKERVFVFVCFLASSVAAAAVIFSPGNFYRMEVMQHDLSLLQSVYLSFLQTARFFLLFTSSIHVLLVSVFVFLIGSEIKKRIDFPLLYFALCLFVLFVAALIPYLAFGQLGQHRTFNYVAPFFLTFWLLFIVAVRQANIISSLYKIHFTTNLKKTFGFVVVASFFFSKQSLNIYNDVRNERLKQYNQEYILREQFLYNNPSLTYPLKVIPESLKITDAKGDSTYFADMCMCRFYENVNRSK